MTIPARAGVAAAAEIDAGLVQFEAFLSAFDRAAESAGAITPVGLRIGGKRVLLRFAGPGLTPYLLPAFRHLRDDSITLETAELTICVWDSASTGVSLPPEVGDLVSHHRRGMPDSQPDARVLSTYLRPDPGLSMLDLESNCAGYWISDAVATPYEARAGTFRSILSWWMAAHGRQFLHGAAVGDARGGVLVVGKGGSGKSTTALSCLAAGFEYVGDDYCLLEPGLPPVVHSLFGSAKLHADHIERFPRLAGLVTNPARLQVEKGVFLLGDHMPERLVASLIVRAVLVPRVVGHGPTEMLPLSSARALAALAPSTLLQLSATRNEALSRMAALVRSVPAFELRLGENIEDIPGAIQALFGQLDSGPRHD
ncbi:MAG: serine kinase [Dehalococcoidia bacterium]|nr:serine kinase [Dehalococcoidia bacterium]